MVEADEIQILQQENALLREKLRGAKILEERMNILEQLSLDPLAIFDENHKCVGVSKSFLDEFGYAKEEDVIGISGIDFIAHSARDLVREFVSQTSSNSYQAEICRRDGSTFQGTVHVTYLPYKGQTVRVASYRNISEIKARESQLETLNEELNTIFDCNLLGIVLFDGDRIIRRANKQFLKIFGIPSEEVIGISAQEFHRSTAQYEQFTELHQKQLATVGVVELEMQMAQHNGTMIWMSIVAKAIDANTPPDLSKGVIWMGEDITNRHQKDQALKDKNNELEIFFQNSMVGVILLRGGRVFHRVNQRALDILGYDNFEEIEGSNVEKIHISNEKFLEFGELFYNSLIQHQVIQVEYQLKRKDGSVVWVSISGSAIDKSPTPDLDKGVLWILDDISDRKKSEELLIELATTDPLTGIYNRRHFFEMAEREINIRNRYSKELTVLMLDIDHFKKINDTYGHNVGDEALKLFSSLCLKNLRDVDILGRIGGEEFAIVLPNTAEDQATFVAERIREEIESKTLNNHNGIPPMTVSIGIACTNQNNELEEIIQLADIALYKAKENGRNRIEISRADDSA